MGAGQRQKKEKLVVGKNPHCRDLSRDDKAWTKAVTMSLVKTSYKGLSCLGMKWWGLRVY